MADQTLAVVVDRTANKVTQSGLTGGDLPTHMEKILAQHGLIFDNKKTGRLLDPAGFTAYRAAQIVADFNRHYDHDPNLYHATDNVTLTITISDS